MESIGTCYLESKQIYLHSVASSTVSTTGDCRSLISDFEEQPECFKINNKNQFHGQSWSS